MSDQNVVVKIKSAVPLPQTVILPLALVQRYGVDRRLVISKREISLPSGVASWMRRDVRYADWVEAETVAEEVVETAVTLNTALDSSTAGGQSEAVAPPKVEAWSEAWTVPALREYAAQHSVELTKDDLKADIIRKLRNSGLPEAAAE